MRVQNARTSHLLNRVYDNEVFEQEQREFLQAFDEDPAESESEEAEESDLTGATHVEYIFGVSERASSAPPPPRVCPSGVPRVSTRRQRPGRGRAWPPRVR